MANQTTPHSITLGYASQLTSRYRANRPANYPICETFEKESVLKMLSHSDAAFMRIYLGEKEDGKVCFVLCAADANGEDILPDNDLQSNELTEDEEELILDDAIRCPEACPPPSPLNQD